MIADAAKSPITETAPPSPQITGNIVTGLKLNLIYVFKYIPYNPPRIAAPTIPPISPSMLFLGLKIGDILCLPISIPVQYAKRIVGNKQYGGARQYIPLKVNAAGVMPIIFAQAIMFIPITFIGFSNNVNNAGGFLHAFTDHTSFWYNFVFAVMIILFTYFYTAITINPTQMAEDMKRNNGFIPGIKPGKKTAEYIDDIMSRITLPGSFFLALVAIMPAFAGIFGVKAEFAQFFGGTSLLILVGVVLDTLQQVESHLLMRHYDGLLKSGRIKGRSGTVAAY